ncbi:MAG TPA: DUF5317 domain-containing protein [Acidimicrobiia bacterium]|nr:DUF5317 domain-containing protein [Acidimicrobiia bacterium]
MLLVLVIAVAVGLARGGKLSNLTEIGVRSWWLLFIGFGLQIGAVFLPRSEHDLVVGLILAAYAPLLLFVWLNRQMAGLWVAGIGILMNFTVIAVNGGMPVMLEAVKLAGGSVDMVLGAKHVALTETTQLAFLSDVIPLPKNVISLGDVFLAIGVGVFLEDQIRRPVRLFAHRVQGTPGSAADR